MKINILKTREEVITKCNIVVPVFQDEIENEKYLTRVSSLLTPSKKKLLAHSVKKWKFKGKKGELNFLDYEDNKGNLKSILLFGLGEKNSFKLLGFKRTIASLFRNLLSKGVKSYTLYIPWTTKSWKLDTMLTKVYLGTALAEYNFDKYKTNDDKKEMNKVNLYIEKLYEKFSDKEVEKIVEDAKITLKAVNNSRDLLNETPMNMYPEVLKNHVVELFKGRKNVSIEVIDFDEMRKKGMNLLAAVGMGSTNKPYMVRVTYKTEKKDAKTLAIVGKGITYDSGGYSLKPSASMAGMHMDMGGATMMIGTMDIITNSVLDFNVEMYLVIAENMISGDAYKNSDIIMGYGKKSVEILNTDAEGRLALADGIAYASENGANTIIDAATLTGACLVALGEEIAAVITKDEDLARRFRDSYEKTEEKFWPLPFEEKYLEDLKSEVADLRNIGKTRWGGTITAGLFLSEFVGEGINYMHLDIAGPAMLSKAVDFYNAGGSGFGVQALTHFIKSGNLFK